MDTLTVLVEYIEHELYGVIVTKTVLSIEIKYKCITLICLFLGFSE